jgi:transposase
MPRYKRIDTNPRFLAVDLAQQLLPGTFEHAVHHLLEHQIDVSVFDARFRNDAVGATAYPPRMLLQVVLCAYAHGIVSSRGIARACEEHVTFIALCGDTRPHFTTLAHFISTADDAIAAVFAAVLAICDRQGLIGRSMFAIDGVKLPSNASKHRSGTRAELAARATKLEAAAATMLARHRAADRAPVEPELAAKDGERLARLEADAAQIRTWLTAHPTDRHGPTGGVRKSNCTDNESAKMATGNGVIQGYTGVAAVDAAHQIVVAAQAYGTGAEQECLLPVVTALAPLRAADTLITADAGYHSEANLAALAAANIDALIADGQLRARDERFRSHDRHRALPDPLHDKTRVMAQRSVFAPDDFTYDPVARTCICPAGKSLYRKGAKLATKGHIADRFQGAKRDCGPCPLRGQCLRTPARTATRQVAFFTGKTPARLESHTARMQRRIDRPEERARYAQRFAVAEPVFGNLCANKRLDHFTLRGQRKVDAQWKLFCLVQNIEKLAHHGLAA